MSDKFLHFLFASYFLFKVCSLTRILFSLSSLLFPLQVFPCLLDAGQVRLPNVVTSGLPFNAEYYTEGSAPVTMSAW